MSNYNQTIDYLFGLQRHGIKLSLDNIQTLLQPLNNPQDNWPSIHIAGTNGKGSTAAIMESILMKAGYRVGLYTSPHLVDFRERIRINRVHIPEDEVIEFSQKMKPLIDKINPSFFEATTAMAFEYFAKEKIDIAIVEVGLGGRLDSTNVVDPLITAITHIDMDHQKYLGKSIQEIAYEKAGIIKTNTPCITNNENQEVLEVLRQKCADLNSEFIRINEQAKYQISTLNLDGTSFKLQLGKKTFKELYLNLAGNYQIDNVILAVGTLLYPGNSINISDNHIFNGLRDVRWRGRINLVSREPFVIVDVSHNASGFERTLTFLSRYFPKEKIHVITTLQEDKDFKKIGKLLSHYAGAVHLVDLKLGKPLNPLTFLETLKHTEIKSNIFDSFRDAQEEIYNSREKDNLWLIIGSHYLAGEAYQKLQIS